MQFFELLFNLTHFSNYCDGKGDDDRLLFLTGGESNSSSGCANESKIYFGIAYTFLDPIFQNEIPKRKLKNQKKWTIIRAKFM